MAAGDRLSSQGYGDAAWPCANLLRIDFAGIQTDTGFSIRG